MTFCSAEYLICTDRADELCPLALLPHCPSFFPSLWRKSQRLTSRAGLHFPASGLHSDNALGLSQLRRRCPNITGPPTPRKQRPRGRGFMEIVGPVDMKSGPGRGVAASLTLSMTSPANCYRARGPHTRHPRAPLSVLSADVPSPPAQRPAPPCGESRSLRSCSGRAVSSVALGGRFPPTAARTSPSWGSGGGLSRPGGHLPGLWWSSLTKLECLPHGLTVTP